MTMAVLAGAGGFTPLGVRFSNDRLTRGADFTGIADSTGFTFSFWFKPSNSGGGTIYNGGGTTLIVFLDPTGYVRFFAVNNTSGATILDTRTSVLAYDVWHQVICSFDGTTGTVRLYVDGASDATTTTATTGTVRFNISGPYPAFGAEENGADATLSDYAEVYFATSYIDLSSAANLQKFLNGVFPVDLGADGARPTGAAPIMYLSKRNGQVASDFATNRGTGGGMTINGTLANSSSAVRLP
jgi:hypothetical protein